MSSFEQVFRRTGNGVSIPLYRPDAPLSDREPPRNLEAERSLLGSILLEPDRLPEVIPLVSVTDFFRDAHQYVYQAILDLYDAGTPVDVITLADILGAQGRFELAGGDEMLSEIVEAVPTAANILYYAGIVAEKAKARRAIDTATGLIRDAYSNQFTADELAERAAQQIAALTPVDDEEGLNLPGAWPEEMAPEAFDGLAGEIVRRILPRTEADPAALLVQFLVAFGNAAGHAPHLEIGAARHGVNLFACIVGRSSRARKGTSWNFIRRIMTEADSDWSQRRILSGLCTGEGMIEAVRDARFKRERVEGAPALGACSVREVEIDPGESDKRALWIESEFGSTLTLKGRDGNALDGKIKEFWETGTVQSNSKANPSRCTGAHVSIIGHVTIRELLRKLSDVDIAGGFANRFLWICSRRTKLLPHPGQFLIADFAELVMQIKLALDGIDLRSRDGEVLISLSPEAERAWDPMYRDLGRDRPGILDEMCARAEPQVLRIAALYAVLDLKARIEVSHLRSAMAVWNYSEASARCIFGDHAHDDPNEHRLFEAIKESPRGLTLTDIRRRVFHGKLSRDETSRIIGSLLRSGKIVGSVIKTPGRDRTVWVVNNGSRQTFPTGDPAPKAP